MAGAVGRQARDATTEPSIRAGTLSAPTSRAAPVGPTRVPAAGRDALRRRVATMSYREGAAALSPRSRATAPAWPDSCPDVAPFVAATGAASTAVFAGLPVSAPRPLDPREAPFPEEREAAKDELHRWHVEATAALVSTRDRMGRAGERFADFAGAGVRSLKSATGRAGTLASVLFGGQGRIAALLAGLLVDAAAKDPGTQVRASLARRLDEEQRAAGADLAGRYESLRLRVVTASTAGAIQAARDAIRTARPGRAPGENQVYRDLLLELARDGGMHLDGSDFNRRRRGGWWQSLSPDRPFAVDGPDVADELNALDAADPSTRADFDTERLP